MSGKELLIDTNIAIYLLNRDMTLVQLLNEKQVYISFITELELMGVKGMSAKYEKQIEVFVQSCHIIPLSDKIKQQYKTIRKKYKLN
jgi:predicted nucleic acid-binding protein